MQPNKRSSRNKSKKVESSSTSVSSPGLKLSSVPNVSREAGEWSEPSILSWANGFLYISEWTSLSVWLAYLFSLPNTMLIFGSAWHSLSTCMRTSILMASSNSRIRHYPNIDAFHSSEKSQLCLVREDICIALAFWLSTVWSTEPHFSLCNSMKCCKTASEIVKLRKNLKNQ